MLVSASTLEPEVRAQLANEQGRGGNVKAAKLIGTRLARKGKGRWHRNVCFLTVLVTVFMAASLRWLRPRVKLA